MIPAFIALLLSMSFTLLAIANPHLSLYFAFPVAIAALILLRVSAKGSR
jgi:hypothetical protein